MLSSGLCCANRSLGWRQHFGMGRDLLSSQSCFDYLSWQSEYPLSPSQHSSEQRCSLLSNASRLAHFSMTMFEHTFMCFHRVSGKQQHPSTSIDFHLIYHPLNTCELSQRLSGRPHINIVGELETVLQQEWNAVPQDIIQRLIRSMSRLQMVVTHAIELPFRSHLH